MLERKGLILRIGDTNTQTAKQQVQAPEVFSKLLHAINKVTYCCLKRKYCKKNTMLQIVSSDLQILSGDKQNKKI